MPQKQRKTVFPYILGLFCCFSVCWVVSVLEASPAQLWNIGEGNSGKSAVFVVFLSVKGGLMLSFWPYFWPYFNSNSVFYPQKRAKSTIPAGIKKTPFKGCWNALQTASVVVFSGGLVEDSYIGENVSFYRVLRCFQAQKKQPQAAHTIITYNLLIPSTPSSYSKIMVSSRKLYFSFFTIST